MGERLKTEVHCYSGSRYGEHPQSFEWESRHYEIAAILQQWRLPDGPCYRVITQDEERFDLIYLEHEDRWGVYSLT